MHSIERSPEPHFLADVRASYASYGDLNGDDRGRKYRREIRAALAQDFSGICAYCERYCEPQVICEDGEQPLSVETTDHFRPQNRSEFNDHSLEWLNLVYACRRCNLAKGGKWPEFIGEDSGSLSLVATEFVSPNALEGQRTATDYFSYDIETGRVESAALPDIVDRAVARLTISALDLNDDNIWYEEGNLCERRKLQRELVTEAIDSLTSVGFHDLANYVRTDAASPDRPFSSYIASCLSVGRI